MAPRSELVPCSQDFLRYLAHKRRFGVWGDDPEIQAMSELYGRSVEILTFDEHAGARVLRTFHEPTANEEREPIRLSCFGGGHFDSIVGATHAASCIRSEPGVVEDARISASQQRIAFENSFDLGRLRTEGAAEAEELSRALAASREVFRGHNDDVDATF
jgi:OTU domain-containing protein 5